jgi:hypothetical protein
MNVGCMKVLESSFINFYKLILLKIRLPKSAMIIDSLRTSGLHCHNCPGADIFTGFLNPFNCISGLQLTLEEDRFLSSVSGSLYISRSIIRRHRFPNTTGVLK